MAAPLNVKRLTRFCASIPKFCVVLQNNERIVRKNNVTHLLLDQNRSVTWSKLQFQRKYCSQTDRPKTILDSQLTQEVRKAESLVSDDDLENIFALRYIYVRTNVGEWEDFPEGVEFDVGYIDTAAFDSNVSQTAPVILGIPSSMGTHEELLETLITFARLGYRVVIINLPDNGVCKGCRRKDSTVFLHTVDDRAQFIQDFLKELYIDRVDMVVSNSCSVYSAVSLASTKPDLFRSLVLINPTGLQYTKDMLPVKLHCGVGYVWDEYYYLQPFVKSVIWMCKNFTKKSHWPVSKIVANSKIVRQLHLGETSSDQADTSYFQEASELVKSGIPVCAIYGEDTSNFEREVTEEYLDRLGVPQSAVSVYEEDKKQFTKKGSNASKNRGIYVKDQPADINQWYLPFVRRVLLDFLKSVRKEN